MTVDTTAGASAIPDRRREPLVPALTRRASSAIGPAAFLAAIVAAWYGVSGLVPADKELLTPRPHEIWEQAFADSDIRGELLAGLGNTTKVAAFGLAISILVGISFAAMMAQRRWLERGFFPWAVVLQTVPTLALVPLIGVWFGFGFKSRVIVVVLITIFPITTNTLFGLQSVPDDVRDLFRLHHAGWFTRMARLYFPAAMPAIFTGFRISAGLSVIGAIVGEFFFGRGGAGLGVLVNKYRGLLDIEALYATILVSSALGISVFWLFTWLSHRVIGHWHQSVQGSGSGR